MQLVKLEVLAVAVLALVTTACAPRPQLASTPLAEIAAKLISGQGRNEVIERFGSPTSSSDGVGKSSDGSFAMSYEDGSGKVLTLGFREDRLVRYTLFDGTRILQARDFRTGEEIGGAP